MSNKDRAICLIWCTLMLCLSIWLCGCSKRAESKSTTSDEQEYHITIYYPNTRDVYVEGDGDVFWMSSTDHRIKVQINGKRYSASWNNVIIEWDGKR